MKPFSFYPTASGAAKTQSMSASDITRINRIRASSAAYPNILSNPPKNISNLSLNTSQIASIRLGNTINNGIFNYKPKVQPVVSVINDMSDVSGGGGAQPDYGQPVDSAKIINNKLRIVFTYSKSITDFEIYIHPVTNYYTTFSITDLSILDTNIYLLEKLLSEIGSTPPVGEKLEFYFLNNSEYKEIVVS